jgi:hypothetical protein
MRWTRRVHILLVAVMLTAAVAAPPSAAAVNLSSATTVVDVSCRSEWVWGDAARGTGGMTRGFVSFDGGACGTQRYIYWFAGRGDAWHSGETPYAGVVMAVAADGGSALVLYANGEGTFLGRRSNDGDFANPRRLSRHGLTGAVIPSGDVIGLGGKFWAVWSEQVGEGGEFAQTELFQSQNVGEGHYFDGVMPRTRITFSSQSDDFPTLIAEPAGDGAQTFALAWGRNDGAQGASSDLWFARSSGDGAWAKVTFATKGYNTTPDLFATTSRLWMAWTRNGMPAVTWRTSGGWKTGQTFPRHEGMRPRVAAGGDAFIAWTSLRPRDVYMAQRDDPAWAVANATPGTDGERMLLALTANDGTATLVYAARDTGRVVVKTSR